MNAAWLGCKNKTLSNPPGIGCSLSKGKFRCPWEMSRSGREDFRARLHTGYAVRMIRAAARAAPIDGEAQQSIDADLSGRITNE
jgi:hypothetical protein